MTTEPTRNDEKETEHLFDRSPLNLSKRQD